MRIIIAPVALVLATLLLLGAHVGGFESHAVRGARMTVTHEASGARTDPSPSPSAEPTVAPSPSWIGQVVPNQPAARGTNQSPAASAARRGTNPCTC